MKRIALILTLFLTLSPACLAQGSHLDDFLSGVSQSFSALQGMASDAGQAVTDWANDSGVAEWAEGAARDIYAWASDSGLVEWAQGALDDITAWADDNGLTDLAHEVQAFIEDNGPAVEAWLAQAGEDVRQAWDTLVNADEHTQQELQDAYDTVVESLDISGDRDNESQAGHNN